MEATEGGGGLAATGSGLLHPSWRRPRVAGGASQWCHARERSGTMTQSEQKKPEGEADTQAAVQTVEPSIHIAIDAKGNIVIETVGTKGKQCDLLTGALEAKLGEVTTRVNKDCYEEQS